MVKFVFAGTLMLLASLAPLAPAEPAATSWEQRKINYEWAWEVATAARMAVRDFNGDGEVTCIDWAFAFIHEWQRLYPRYAGSVAAVVNQTERLNHMFVQIWVYDPETFEEVWWAVEPSAMYEGQLDMRDCWGDDYDPSANRTGEPAEKWLRRCRW